MGMFFVKGADCLCVALLATACTGQIGTNTPVSDTPSADYVRQWWFDAPARSTPPRVKDPTWIKQPIDAFTLAQIQAAGLIPRPEADRRTLIRRASLDTRGLPPSPAEVDAFLADDSADAYERLVDKLLGDTAFGEHRAHYWLDVARYGDTHGFELDNYRSVWPYRDYVVRAFNGNMPFDQFTIEQLAGDLLEQPTVDQRVATGFGRCAMSTAEGGAIEDEFAAIAAKDRVETVAAAWIGLTVGCATCHDHKFDPVTQKEFYQLTAFFRNTTQAVFDDNAAAPPPAVSVGSDMTPSLVTEERPEEPYAFVLNRGRYDQKGDRVTPGVPRVLPPLPDAQPANRLGLANWLVAPSHPLMARVAINRFWAELFGIGIVGTPENFGMTGDAPTNQPLLDWLAVEFRESGWDVKHMFRLMLTSATYRQSVTHTPEGDAVDPDNRLLWHGPRFRLDAEVIRDQALAASDLLVRTMGGPPVKPYQPPGLWEAVAIDGSNTATYEQDSGEALFRRSLYTFWKRAAPPASLEIFNAPTRESTVVRRDRASTPLQALVTMNDPQFLEAARHLAVNAILNAGDLVDSRLDYMGLRLLARPLDDAEHLILSSSLETLLTHYEASPDEAASLLAVGVSPVDATIPAPTQAAWMMVASELLMLDEVLMK
jgi:Protein of unknown function (DUF1553)/Protein of unknown function (DUF1549)